MEKICRTLKGHGCGQLLDVAEFGTKNICRSCQTAERRIFSRSVTGLIRSIYAGQIQSSKKRGFPEPRYTRDELIDLLSTDDTFMLFYNAWVDSGYEKDMRPSCDRKDDYLPYSMLNIQIMTFKENREKYYQDAKNGINTKACKAVVRMNSYDGSIIDEFHSTHNAADETGINQGSIHRACSGIYKTAGGFTWKFK